MLQPQREAIGKPPRLRHLVGRQAAPRHRHLDMLARLRRRVGGIGKLDLGLARQDARGTAKHGLEAIERGFAGHYQSTLQPKAVKARSRVTTVRFSTRAWAAINLSNGSL